jgi:ABC-type lipoprotein release transport system permease subunit
MALGSSRTGIARLILREGLSLLITGICLGMAAAIAFARLLRSFLNEVPALLLIATLAACLIPSARRSNGSDGRPSSRVDQQ